MVLWSGSFANEKIIFQLMRRSMFQKCLSTIIILPKNPHNTSKMGEMGVSAGGEDHCQYSACDPIFAVLQDGPLGETQSRCPGSSLSTSTRVWINNKILVKRNSFQRITQTHEDKVGSKNLYFWKNSHLLKTAISSQIIKHFKLIIWKYVHSV